MSQNFKLFRLFDTAVFVGVNAIPTAAFIYACLHGLTANTQAFALMLIVTACFWAGYVVFLLARKVYLDSISYVTKDNLGIITNGFDVKQADIEALTADTITKWNSACNFTSSAVAIDGLVIEFKTPPVTPENRNFGSLAGFLSGGKAVVGFKADLKTTAFQHELGHAVHHEFTNAWDNDACHKFMAKFNLL
jgi:hypothetical protein